MPQNPQSPRSGPIAPSRYPGERLGLPASACLFVDDMEINCEAARDLGFTAVQYHDPAQTIAEVRAALAL